MTTAQIFKKGFTLIELLVVIGILAVLLAIVLIAINPAHQFALANNTQRSNDVNSILNAIGQYQAENNGNLPTGLVNGQAYSVANTVGGVGQTGQAFCDDLVPKHIAELPRDPQTGAWVDCTDHSTGYTVTVSTPPAGQSARVTVSADSPQEGAVISVTR